jgi:hypothetical protein
MTTMIPDLVVGAVGFGPNFAADPADGEIIAELRAQIADLKRQRSILREALQGCAALSDVTATAKHEALLQTDPKNIENEQENR